MAAPRDVETKGLAVVQQAQAEQDAALAPCRRLVRVLAQADADALTLRHGTTERHYEVEAKGRRAINEAENPHVAGSDGTAGQAGSHRQDRGGGPRKREAKLEHISDIRIVHVEWPGRRSPQAGADSPGGATLSDQVMNSALKYKLQSAPGQFTLLEVGRVCARRRDRHPGSRSDARPRPDCRKTAHRISPGSRR